MSNKEQRINQKIGTERGKQVWLIKDSKGKVVNKFRIHNMAQKERDKLNREGFDTYTIERDNSYRTNMKEVLNESKKRMSKV